MDGMADVADGPKRAREIYQIIFFKKRNKFYLKKIKIKLE